MEKKLKEKLQQIKTDFVKQYPDHIGPNREDKFLSFSFIPETTESKDIQPPVILSKSCKRYAQSHTVWTQSTVGVHTWDRPPASLPD